VNKTETRQSDTPKKWDRISYWLLLLAIVCCGGCGPAKPTAMIVGTWKAPAANQNSLAPAGMRSGKTPVTVSKLKQDAVAGRVTITFFKDNTFELDFVGLIQKGQWSYDEDRKAFLLQNKKSNETAERRGAAGVKMSEGFGDTWVVYLDADKGQVELFTMGSKMAGAFRGWSQGSGSPKGYVLEKQ
jgi:hypothetical protein